jgi:hypothetical protein
MPLKESFVRGSPYGIDIGRSGIKLVAPSLSEELIPASAALAFPLDDPGEVGQARLETVRVAGRDWFFGQTAQVQASPEPGLHPDYHRTAEYEVLVAGSIQVLAAGDQGKTGCPLTIVAGLPSEATLDDKTFVQNLFHRYAPAGSVVRVIAQPAGALFCASAARPDLLKLSVVVVDVGRYSTDLAVTRAGRPVQGAFQSLPGVRLAVESLLASVRRDLSGAPSFERLETALRTGKLVHAMREHDVAAQAAQACAVLQSEVNRALKALSNQMRGQIDAVVLAGGGADLITLDVPSVIAPGGRFAVARGFARIATELAARGLDHG